MYICLSSAPVLQLLTGQAAAGRAGRLHASTLTINHWHSAGLAFIMPGCAQLHVRDSAHSEVLGHTAKPINTAHVMARPRLNNAIDTYPASVFKRLPPVNLNDDLDVLSARNTSTGACTYAYAVRTCSSAAGPDAGTGEPCEPYDGSTVAAAIVGFASRRPTTICNIVSCICLSNTANLRHYSQWGSMLACYTLHVGSVTLLPHLPSLRSASAYTDVPVVTTQ